MNINDADAGDPDEVQFKPFELWLTERALNALEAYKRNMARAEGGLGDEKTIMLWREESRSCAAEFAAECLRIVLEDAEAEMHEDERIEQAQAFINQMAGV